MSKITSAVRLLSTLHANKAAVQSGRTTADELVKKTIFSPEYFPAFLACSMAASGYAGWKVMESRRSAVATTRERRFESSYPKAVYEQPAPSLDPRFRGE